MSFATNQNNFAPTKQWWCHTIIYRTPGSMAAYKWAPGYVLQFSTAQGCARDLLWPETETRPETHVSRTETFEICPRRNVLNPTHCSFWNVGQDIQRKPSNFICIFVELSNLLLSTFDWQFLLRILSDYALRPRCQDWYHIPGTTISTFNFTATKQQYLTA